MKQDTKVFIDNHEVDTLEVSSIAIKKQFKDIKEFAKRKTSFSKPIKVLHTDSNSRLFHNAFNINEVGGFDVNSTPKARVEVNGEVVLDGVMRLDNFTDKYYNVTIYNPTVNLETLFGDADLRGNVVASKDLVMQDTTQHTITFDSMRTFMNSTYPNDGSTLYWGWAQLRHHNGILRLGDDVILPSVPAREVLVDLLHSVGKSVVLSPEIEKYITHLVLPFNSEYTELTTPWLAYMYNFGTPELSTEKLPKGQLIWKDLRVVFDHYSKEAAETSTVDRSHIRIRTRGTHHITMDVELRRSTETTDIIYASPRAILKFNDGTTEELKLEGDKVHLVGDGWHSGTFTASFNTQSIHDVDLYFGHTPISTESNNGNFEIKGNVGIVHRDAYYSGQLPFTKSSVLPVGYKKKDFFNDIVKMFNATVVEKDNTVTIKTYKEYLGEVIGTSADWSNLIDTESVQLKPLSSENPSRLEFTMGTGSSLYTNDYKDSKDKGISDRLLDISENKDTVGVVASSTFGANLALLSTSPQNYIPNVAILADKGSNFTTKNKARMLFTGDGQLQDGYSEIPKSFGTEANTYVKGVANIPILSTRYSNDLEAADNTSLSFEDLIYYSLDSNFTEDYKTKGTTGNLYSRFYSEFDIYNSDVKFLKAKFMLSSKDISDTSFNDNIFIDMGKNGSGVFRINSILDYKPGANALTTVELVQVSGTTISNFEATTKTLALKVLSSESEEVKSVGTTGGSSASGSSSGVDIDTVNALIDTAVSTKLDKTEQAADSKLLEGHSADYFATQAEVDTKANLDGGNTFTGTQVFEGDIIQSGAAYETHAEEIFSKQDKVTLREEAITGLGTGELSGFRVINPTGDTQNTVWGVDNTGLLKLGKEGTTYQTIATRDDDITDNNGVVWDAPRKTFKDAGYKWAFKNGDITQSFNGHVITSDIYLQTKVGVNKGIYRQDRLYGYKEGVGVQDFGLNNDRTILANVDGTLEAKGLHSATYISGIGGKGTYNISANSEMDNLSIREAFKVNTFVNNKINIQNGDMIVSDSATIDTYIGFAGRITFKEQHPFSRYDIIRCQKLDGTVMKSYTFEVLLADQLSIDIINLSGTGTPESGDLLTRWSGGLLYLNSSDEVNGAYLDVMEDGLTKTRLGNLTGINDPQFGQLQGQGVYSENFYGRGDMVLGANSSIDFSSVKNVNIGGTNLFPLNSAHSYAPYNTITINGTAITATITRGSGTNFTLASKVLQGINTLSGRMLINGNPLTSDVILRANTYNSSLPIINTVDEDGNFVITEDYDSGSSWVFHTGTGLPTGSVITIENFKVEKGTVSTDWSPAPEDTSNRLTHIDANGIYSGHAVLGGFDIDTNMIRSVGGGVISPTGRKGHISMSNTTTAYGSGKYFYNGDRTLQGFSIGSDTNATAYNLVMGQMMQNRDNIKLKTYGIQMMDHTSKEYFALGFNTETGASYNRIANWRFDHNTLVTGSSAQDSQGYLTDKNGILFSNGDMRMHKAKIVDGVLYAKDGHFSGTIESSSGKIAGFDLQASTSSAHLGSLVSPRGDFKIASYTLGSLISLSSNGVDTASVTHSNPEIQFKGEGGDIMASIAPREYHDIQTGLTYKEIKLSLPNIHSRMIIGGRLDTEDVYADAIKADSVNGLRTVEGTFSVSTDNDVTIDVPELDILFGVTVHRVASVSTPSSDRQIVLSSSNRSAFIFNRNDDFSGTTSYRYVATGRVA